MGRESKIMKTQIKYAAKNSENSYWRSNGSGGELEDATAFDSELELAYGIGKAYYWKPPNYTVVKIEESIVRKVVK